jgi:hypothetical protein
MELRKSQRGLRDMEYDTVWITCFPVRVASQLYFVSFTAR